MPYTPSAQFEQAMARFDELNSKDPNQVDIDGVKEPKELYHAKRTSFWLAELYPEADEATRLAARCQHLCRWEIPRKTYPEGRSAYLKWRTDLKKFHASKSAEVLEDIGYDQETIDAVKTINLKKDLKTNPGSQAVEDALCMVFLETQFESYVGKWEDDKMIKILQKTWSKMSSKAQEAALKLKFNTDAQTLIQKALS